MTGTSLRAFVLAVLALAAVPSGASTSQVSPRATDSLARDTAADRDRGVPPALRGIRIEERAGAQVPLDVELVDQDGAERTLAELVDGTTPVVLALGYYRCPMLCGVVFERLAAGLAEATPVAGRGWRAVAVSIDPRESPADARARRDAVLPSSFGRTVEHASRGAVPTRGEGAADADAGAEGEAEAHAGAPGAGARSAWTFFVAPEPTSRAIADALGFRYRYDQATDQYAHAAGAFVLTPDGRLSRTLQGIDFAPATLDAAIADAGAGRAHALSRGAGPLESVLVQCFRYMPALRRHAGSIATFLRAGGAAVVVALAALVVFAARRRRLSSQGAAP